MALSDLINANPDATADQLRALNVPSRTPRKGTITLTTLASATTGWGLARATEFVASLSAASASLPIATTIIAMLNGPGFDPSDAEVNATVPSIIAAGLCSQDEADKVLYDVVYPAGSATFTDDDVEEARRMIQAAALIEESRQWEQAQHEAIASRAAAFVTAVEAWRSGDAPSIGSI